VGEQAAGGKAAVALAARLAGFQPVFSHKSKFYPLLILFENFAQYLPLLRYVAIILLNY
jgi:hypothetical protein